MGIGTVGNYLRDKPRKSTVINLPKGMRQDKKRKSISKKENTIRAIHTTGNTWYIIPINAFLAGSKSVTGNLIRPQVVCYKPDQKLDFLASSGTRLDLLPTVTYHPTAK